MTMHMWASGTFINGWKNSKGRGKLLRIRNFLVGPKLKSVIRTNIVVGEKKSDFESKMNIGYRKLENCLRPKRRHFIVKIWVSLRSLDKIHGKQNESVLKCL